MPRVTNNKNRNKIFDIANLKSGHFWKDFSVDIVNKLILSILVIKCCTVTFYDQNWLCDYVLIKISDRFFGQNLYQMLPSKTYQLYRNGGFDRSYKIGRLTKFDYFPYLRRFKRFYQVGWLTSYIDFTNSTDKPIWTI